MMTSRILTDFHRLNFNQKTLHELLNNNDERIQYETILHKNIDHNHINTILKINKVTTKYKKLALCRILLKQV